MGFPQNYPGLEPAHKDGCDLTLRGLGMSRAQIPMTWLTDDNRLPVAPGCGDRGNRQAAS